MAGWTGMFLGCMKALSKGVEMPERVSTLSILFQDICAEVRARRDPEYVYTAATIGALGAVAWGVATIATVQGVESVPPWRHPAMAGAVASVLLTWAVWKKIQREHGIYVLLRAEQVRIAGLLAAETGVQQGELPSGLRLGISVGAGHRASGLVIGSTCLATVLFCLSIWLLR